MMLDGFDGWEGGYFGGDEIGRGVVEGGMNCGNMFDRVGRLLILSV